MATTSINNALSIEPTVTPNSESNFQLHMWQLLVAVILALIFFGAIHVTEYMVHEIDFSWNAVFGIAHGLILMPVGLSWIACLLVINFFGARAADVASKIASLVLVSVAFVIALKTHSVLLMFLWGGCAVYEVLEVVREVKQHWGDRVWRLYLSSALQWSLTMLLVIWIALLS